MSRPIVAAVLLLLALAGLVAAEGFGRLQVTCRPGVRVYLDGEFVGLTTADEDGLFLREVAAGDHVVRVEKLGFEPVDFEVEVRAGRATEVRVDPLTPTQTEAAPLLTPTETPAPTPPPTAVPSRTLVATPAAEPTGLPPTPAPSPTATPVPIPAEPAAAEPMVAALPSPASPPPAAATDLRMPTAETVAPPPAAVAVAPVVVTAPAERVPEPTPPATSTPTPPATLTPTPSPVAVVPTVVLSGSARPASDVAFAYRASGPAAGEGWSIAIWRERGGPSAPVLVLTCSESAPCEQQTSPRFAPGAYRFRVVFSRTQGEGGKAAVLFRHEVAVEIETRSNTAYLVEAMYGGDTPGQCNATVREARFVPGEN